MICRILNSGQATGYRKRAITKWYMIYPVQLISNEWVLPDRIVDDMERMKDQESLTAEERNQAQGVYDSLSNRATRDVDISEFPEPIEP